MSFKEQYRRYSRVINMQQRCLSSEKLVMGVRHVTILYQWLTSLVSLKPRYGFTAKATWLTMIDSWRLNLKFSAVGPCCLGYLHCCGSAICTVLQARDMKSWSTSNLQKTALTNHGLMNVFEGVHCTEKEVHIGRGLNNLLG